MDSWLTDGFTGPLLFLTYFILYALEYFFPLVTRKSGHHRVNFPMTGLLILVNLVFTSVTFAVAGWVDNQQIGLFNLIELPRWGEAVMMIILLDLTAGYLSHLVFHKYALLWHWHVVHHSDDLVDVTTTFRQHPVESTIRILFLLAGLVVFGVPLGVLLIYLALSTLHAQIEHANIRIPASLDRILQYVLVTPNMHKVHHSKHQHETDSNYGNILSVWDRIFGTYNKRKNYDTIEYGLDFDTHQSEKSFWRLVMYPFRKLTGKTSSTQS